MWRGVPGVFWDSFGCGSFRRRCSRQGQSSVSSRNGEGLCARPRAFYGGVQDAVIEPSRCTHPRKANVRRRVETLRSLPKSLVWFDDRARGLGGAYAHRICDGGVLSLLLAGCSGSEGNKAAPDRGGRRPGRPDLLDLRATLGSWTIGPPEPVGAMGPAGPMGLQDPKVMRVPPNHPAAPLYAS